MFQTLKQVFHTGDFIYVLWHAQDSCYHPILTDEKPTTLTEQWAKVKQLVQSRAKIQTLVRLQHAYFSTTPALTPVIDVMNISHVK